MLIYIGADHRGFKLKEVLKVFLRDRGDKVFDLGNGREESGDDYPNFALAVAKKIAEEPAGRRGILICGSGVGMDVVANKVKGVRSALVTGVDQAYASRNDDDTNILTLAADFTEAEKAEKILKTWLETPFSGEEKYKRRLQEISELESGSK